MTKAVITVICLTICALTMSANTRGSTSGSGSIAATNYQDRSSAEDNYLDMEMIMDNCNDTFRIEMAYLESLNDTGSFIDETDKTPKCFIRCVLENTGVMSINDGIFDPARAAVLFAGERNGKTMEDIGDFTALCADRRESCKCEKAYQFMRCLMSMEIERYETSSNKPQTTR